MEENDRPSFEFIGRTIEDAIDRALRELGVHREDVDIEVLTHGTRGMLGFVLEDARVRVTLRRAPGEGPLEPGRVAQEVLEKMLVGMGIRGHIFRHTRAEPGDVQLDVRGRDLGILIGRRGENLRALQYITRLITSHRLKQWIPVVVDVDGYKSRRERTLQEMAKRFAEQVIQSGQPLSLEPMPPHERRAIHLALRDHPAVITQSEGEGDARRVVILPKKL